MEPSRICYIREVYRDIIDLEQYIGEHYHLNLNEAMLLCILQQTSSCTAGELAQRLGITSSNMSKVIAAAERQQLIQRQLGKDDKRKMLFSLTSEGQALLAALKADAVEMPVW